MYISARRLGRDVHVWERTPKGREQKRFPAPYYFYTVAAQGKDKSIYGQRLHKHEFLNMGDMLRKKAEFEAQQTPMYESDIQPDTKVLSEFYYNKPAPKLNVTFLDIEVDYEPTIGFADTTNPYADIVSVALYHQHTDEMLVYTVCPEVWDGTLDDRFRKERIIDQPYITYTLKNEDGSDLASVFIVESEEQLLRFLIGEIQNSDAVSGWNSDVFDVPYIGKRLQVRFEESRKRGLIHREDEPEREWLELFKLLSFKASGYDLKNNENDEQHQYWYINPRTGRPYDLLEPTWRIFPNRFGTMSTTLDLVGRLRIDYLELFKKYEVSDRQSFKLEAVADDVLPHMPKITYKGSLHVLYRKNLSEFIRYNVRDTEILKAFEEKLGYVALANDMYHLSTGNFGDTMGTIQLADKAMINYCHNILNVKVPDKKKELVESRIKGALVLEPKIGLHNFVGSIDINSLYPASIRSLNISPEMIIGQFATNTAAWEAIFNRTDEKLVFVYENKVVESKTAKQWRDFLLDKKWAISGYGTVFDQSSGKGVIPSILEDWYNTRKKYQAAKKQALDIGDNERANYFDRLQYVYKIKLNSFYGALTNMFFRFFDPRMGESTTGTGRVILQHQCSKVAEVLDGEYQMMSDSIIYGDSVAGDTLVYTGEGQVKIQDLFVEVTRTIGSKEYCDTSGVDTLTYDEISNQACYRPIKYVMRHKTHKKMFRVWITNSQYIDVTEDHSLIGYVNTRNRNKTCGKILHEIKPGDIGQVCNTLVYLKTLPKQACVSKNLLTKLYGLMGYVVGDGYVDTTKTGGVLLSIGKQDIAQVDCYLLQPLIQAGWISSYTIKPNGHDIQISSVKLRKFLREHLYTNGIKRTPSWMFNEKVEYICEYLKGWFSADGWFNSKSVVGISNIYQSNIEDLQRLLFLCGVSSTWFTERTPNYYIGTKTTGTGTFSKRLTIKNRELFMDRIGFIQSRKNKPVIIQVGTRKMNIQNYDFEIVNVCKIEQIHYENFVYDVEVDGTHMFFANNILVHNTDSSWFLTHTDNIDDAVKIADSVADVVNKSFQDFVREAFLCQPGFDDIIKTGREVVSDSGIFVDKKRYILHIADMEGKRVDKMKIMGVEIKKTTTPKPIKKMLETTIRMILQGKPDREIDDYILDSKDFIQNEMDLLDLGLPKGVKKVTHYTELYNEEGKRARLPGHTAAAIFYNQCLEDYEDKESVKIVSGSKIRVFNLKNKIGKFASIALPTDIEQVPEWFTDYFEPQIDRALMSYKLLDKNLLNVFKAINRHIPTREERDTEETWVW